MGIPLHVLVLEDSKSDYELLIRELRRGGYEPESTRVETEADMKAALAKKNWDIIISDFSMPQFNSFDALKILKESGLDLPFIVSSGTIGEDMAVLTLKAGAHDYFMKDKLVRLCPAVERELRDAGARRERKLAEDERERILRWQEGVNLLQQSLLAPAPLEQKLKIITDSIVRLFDADFCRIWLIRPGDRCEQGCIHAEVKEGPHVCSYRDRCLHLMSSSGRYTHTDGKGHRRVPFGAYKIGRIASGDEHKFITNDAENDPRVHDHEWVRNLGLVSFVGYQLRVPGSQTMGVLALFAKHQISSTEDAMLDGLGSTIALVVQQAEGEEALRQSEMRYRTIGRLSTDFAYSCVKTGGKGFGVDWITDAFFSLTGVSRAELAEQSCWMYISHPDDKEMAMESLRRLQPGESDIREFRVVTRDGRVLTFLNHMECEVEPGRPGGLRIYGTVKDITERKQLEEQLHQAMKMEAIGRLAGGVAHDFNNILAVILSYAGFIIEKLKENDPMREDAQEIKDAANRAAALTRQLLAFSRKEIIKPEIINLNSVVTNLEKMLIRIIGEDLELSISLDKNLSNIKADPGQMEQMLANLAVNARDAMIDGGKLLIETKNVCLDQEYSENHLFVAPGSYVMLAVSDTGCGMDAKTLTQIFEPFFTTKELGKGTGLGLSTVYGIVKQNNGYILAYSEPGQGTSFKIYLPIIESSVVPVKKSLISEDNLLQGTETILLVEDEDAVRKIAGRLLRKNGYTVIEANNGGEAFLACESHDGPIHLLLTDVIMPLMSGKALADRLIKIHPELKVVYMSGYTNNAIAHHGVIDADVIFVQKPFTEKSLLVKVREALGNV